ncbi:TniQ family protein [Undibacterium sp. LFS511W]|uniref:TniQ family protein n=2 Tax=Undibacterium luofuense TaxID=2828733 RepID=A0A941DIR0_9BURK|nr:TniQ family protein [Undibacterium luofuense]
MNIEQDELFSTWLVRAALAQGTDPLVLASHLWPGWRVCTIDLDRGVSEECATRLVQESGIQYDEFYSASFLPIAKAIGQEIRADRAIWYWFLALGSRNRKRHGGLQYCSHCLATDTRPYFRVQWRLAWHTCCAIHKICLRDRCWYCHMPIEPNRLSAQDLMSTCPSCKRDLRDAVMVPASASSLEFQEYADNVVITNSGFYGAHQLKTTEWFFLARYLLMLLRFTARNQTSNVRKCLASLLPSVSCLKPPITGLGFEMLPTSERANFLESVGVLIRTGPEHFRSAVLAHSLTGMSLRQGWQILPQYIHDIVQEIPQLARSRSTNIAVVSAPKSKQTVLYKWARLQRKIRRFP